MEITVAIIFQQCDQLILLLLKHKWQLLSKDTHHVQCSCLFIQTVSPDVHTFVLGVLVILLHQFIVVILLVIINDDVVDFGRLEHEWDDLLDDGELFVHDLDQGGEPFLDCLLHFRVDQVELAFEEVHDA